MMVEQAALFYGFSLERHVPADHLLRSIDRFVDLSGIREHLRPFYSETGRPSVDPELMIRMLLIGYCQGIRSERRLCEEVHLNLAYRWFCRLGLDGAVPDHSTFSKNRHGRFRDSDLLRKLFEVTAAKRMLCRTHDGLGLWPRKLIADTGYGSAEMLSWLVEERAIEPHIPVFDKSDRDDGTCSRSDFVFDRQRDVYTCPGGKQLSRFQRRLGTWTDKPHADGFFRYRASKADCDACELKARCCPNAEARKVMRSAHEGARDLARRVAEENEWLASRRERKKVEMLFAHLKRILKLDRLRLRGRNGARDELHLAATPSACLPAANAAGTFLAGSAQNLRKLAKLVPMPTPAMAT